MPLTHVGNGAGPITANVGDPPKRIFPEGTRGRNYGIQTYPNGYGGTIYIGNSGVSTTNFMYALKGEWIIEDVGFLPGWPVNADELYFVVSVNGGGFSGGVRQ